MKSLPPGSERLAIIFGIVWLGTFVAIMFSDRFDVQRAAKPLGYNAKSIGWVLVWREIEARRNVCEHERAAWFKKMNRCLGDLSTACFDPEYCEGMRAAAHSAELIELEEKKKKKKKAKK